MALATLGDDMLKNGYTLQPRGIGENHGHP